MAGGDDDGYVKVWNVETQACVAEKHAHPRSVQALVQIDGCLVSGGRDATVLQWDPRDNAKAAALRTAAGCNALAATGPRLAVGCADGTLAVYDLRNLVAPVCSHAGAHNGQISAVALLGDGVVSGGREDMLVRLWDDAGGQLRLVKDLAHHTSCIFAIAVRSQSQLIVGSNDTTVSLWDR